MGGAHLLMTFCWLSPVALAAPARHHKHGHGAHKKPDKTVERTAPPGDSSPPPADTLPPDSAGPPADAPAASEPAPSEPITVPAPAAKVAPAPAEDAAPVAPSLRRAPRDSEPGDDALALGRQELARRAASRIEVAVIGSLDVGRRDFTYSDPIGALPQSYQLAAAPLATVGMEVYPFASTGVPVLQDLGVRGRFSRAFAIGSATTQGAHLDTRWMRVGGDLRERFLFPASRLREAGVALGIDDDDFSLQTDRDVGALVPAARMVALRFGVDGRIFVTGRISVLAGGGYLLTLSRGQIYDRFRAPKVAGLDGEVAVSLRLTAAIDLRLAGRYTRYFASFTPQVGDPLVAGGALDQQLQAGLGVRYAH